MTVSFPEDKVVGETIHFSANFRGKEWVSLEDTKARTLKAELTEAHNVSGKISRTPTVMYSCTETGSLPSEGV